MNTYQHKSIFSTFLLLKVLLSLLLLLPTPRANAQESTVKINYQGKDYTQLKHAWTAQWITHPSASTLDYGVFLFRRSFDLEEVPDSFIVYLSADNRYRFYVNGLYICQGPAEGDLLNWRYEKLNIAPYLKTGENVLAAEVINFGEYRKAAQQTFQTAFILQGDKTDPVNVNTGTFQWKVIRNDAYTYIPFTPDSLKAYYAAGPGDRVDGQRYPWGWQQTGFDDSRWLKPKKGTVEFAVGRGFLYGSTWFLVPREIPFMEETEQRFSRIIRSHGIPPDPFFIKGKGPLTIPPHSRVSLLLDHSVHTTGYPKLIYSKGKGSRIRITYAEALYKKNPVTRISDGNMILYDLKGNRNIFTDKEIRGIYDIILPDGGDKREFVPWGRRTYRFVQFDIRTGNEPLVLEDYHSIYTVYPFRKKGKFISNDTLLNKIFEVSWRTLRNSAAETFMDPYYEQLQYIGDTRIEALISLYVSGDDRLMRKALCQFDDSRVPLGLTQSRYPAYITQIIPPYSLIWIDMIHDYFLYRDDPGFLSRFLPGMQDVLRWFAGKTDSTGLLTDLEWWNFTDWAKGFMNGIPPGADDGYSANISLQYVLALQNAADIFEHFGRQEEAAAYRAQAGQVIRAVNERCFDKRKGLFAETPEKKIFSQHTNIFAILTDVLPLQEQPALMEKILTDTSLIQSTIYFRFYLFRALQKAGLASRYTAMMAPWERMIRNGMTTFGETDVNPRSECHGWSASPAFDLLHTVAGIYPGAPGFKTVTVAPAPGDLQQFHAEMPLPAGMISMDLKKRGSAYTVTLVLPEKQNGTLLWQGEKTPLHPGKQVLHLKKKE